MNLATIGTSRIAEEFICSAKKTGRYTLHTVYSRDIKTAEAFACKNGAKYFCNDFARLLDKSIDLVYIASPNSLHYNQAAFFLENGIHVICEKPLATKKGEFELLYKAANENGVYLFEGLRHIHTPGFSLIKEQIKEIAPVRNVVLCYNQYSSKYDAFKNGIVQNVFDKAFDGGARLDLGVYPISLAVALFGQPLKSFFTSVPLENGIDGAGSYLLNYGGFICNITFSKISEDIIQNEIIGENGGIRFDKVTSLANIELCLRGGNQPYISPIQDADNMCNNMCYEALAFANIIDNNDIETYHKLMEISKLTNELLVEVVNND